MIQSDSIEVVEAFVWGKISACEILVS